jgi:hypothetical protein
VFSGSQAVAAGTVTAGELRGPAFQRLFRDVHACADLDVTHQLRAVAAARLLVPGSVVTGRSAPAVWGLPPDDAEDVELTVPPGSAVSRLPGLRIRRRAPDPRSITEHRGVRTTTVEVTAVDLARTGPLDEAVVLVDRLVDRRLTTLTLVRAAAAGVSGRGCRQVRAAVALADGLAGSPQETRLRMLLHRSGLPAGAHRELASGGGREVLPFAWPGRKVAVEYEGRWHGESPQQVAADRRRLNRLREAGWTVVFVTAEDLHRPQRVVALIAAELSG